MHRPLELLPIFQQRIWGRKSLEPFFANAHTDPIGEVWFTFIENQTSVGKNLGRLLSEHPELLGSGADPRHPGICPILVKLLFTTGRLSVQVHPDDEYAARHHSSLGKTEAWYVLESTPPGEVAAGFKRALSKDEFKRSIETGEIEKLLEWRPVAPGDLIFTPAGTVHAIGAGVTICEIQENSDITYRLYDYGRPRELHIEHGAAVSSLEPHDCHTDRIDLSAGREELAACGYFRIERLRPQREFVYPEALPFYSILICIAGTGILDGNPCRAGQAWFVPAQTSAFKIEAPGSEWIWTYKAEASAI